MLGAIIGDIVGSRFEFVEDDNRGKDFTLFTSSCHFTDDSLMTLAIAKTLIVNKEWQDLEGLKKTTVRTMKEIAKAYPNVGWGASFYKWLFENSAPYNSYGNGAGMRIGPIGWVTDSEEQVKTLSKAVTEISHSHPEGIKGAEAIATAIYLARTGNTKEYIRERMSKYYNELFDPSFSIKNLLENYGYDEWGNWVTCQGSIPQAIVAFLDGESFEDVIRNAVAIGGDSDTIGAMAGSIAEAYYGISYELEDKALEYLPYDLKSIYYAFGTIKKKRVVRNK